MNCRSRSAPSRPSATLPVWGRGWATRVPNGGNWRQPGSPSQEGRGLTGEGGSFNTYLLRGSELRAETSPQRGDGAARDRQISLKQLLLVLADEHLIFQQARATGGTVAVVAQRPLHIGQLRVNRLLVFFEMAQGDRVGSLAAEEEARQKLILGEARRDWRGQPRVERGAASGGE